MKKDTENQLMKMLKSLINAVEERDARSIGKILGPTALVSAFGTFYYGKELVAAIPVYVDSVEEVSIKVMDLTNFKEGKELSSFAFNVEISFVETTRWTLKRYKLMVTTGYSITDKTVRIKALTLSDLLLDSVRQPDFADHLGTSLAMPEIPGPGFTVPGFTVPGFDFGLGGVSTDQLIPGTQRTIPMPQYPMGQPMPSYPMMLPMPFYPMMPNMPHMPIGYTPNPFPSPYPFPPPSQWGGSIPWGGGHFGGVSG